MQILPPQKPPLQILARDVMGKTAAILLSRHLIITRPRGQGLLIALHLFQDLNRFMGSVQMYLQDMKRYVGLARARTVRSLMIRCNECTQADLRSYPLLTHILT